MYKDVKKKLLAVVLSICMVIGVIEVVPRVKAAAGSPTITVDAKYAGEGDVTTFTVRLSSVSFTYNGTEQKPVIDSITDQNNQSYDTSLFNLGTPESKQKGEYTATLQSGSSGWQFESGSTLSTTYEITAAPIASVYAQTNGQPVVEYTGSVVVPDKSSVTVTINGGTTLKDGQYTIEGTQSTVGVASAKVKVTDGNYDQGTIESNDISYIIAYNLGNTNGNSGPVGALDNTNLDYNPGTPIADPVANFVQSGSTVLSVSRINNPSSMLAVRYNKLTVDASGNVTNRTPVNGSLTSAGEYEMIVTTADGYQTANINGVYFTGTFTARFSVQRIGVGSLIVSATDIYGVSHDLNGNNAYRLQLPYANRDSAGRVHPSNIVVRTGQDINSPILDESNYTITYENDTQPGVATMTITPNSNTDYTGSITIYYYITSSLSMKKTVITGENGGTIVAENGEEPHIVYDGLQHNFDPTNCEVYADGRDTKLTYGENRDYTLSVQYWDGQNYQDITDDNKEKLAEVGRKRIVITGHTTYDGQIGYQLFYIDAVDLSIPENRAKCRLELDPSTYYYNGSAIVPGFRFYYNGALVGSKDDPQGNFTVNATNNVNAGNDAKLTLNMTGTNFAGTYETTFSILPLPYSNLVIDGTYTYNGEQQIPVYKIRAASYDVDYTLVAGRDYEMLGYRTGSAGSFGAEAPINAGTYEVQIRITTGNIDCEANHVDTRTFTIEKCNLANLPIIIDPAQTNDNNEVEWTGGKTEPGISNVPSYLKASDYVVTYANNTAVSAGASGTAILYVTPSTTGAQNFTGQKEIKFTIISRDLGSSEVGFNIVNASAGAKPPYTLRLDVTDTNRSTGNQTLALGTDYEINQILYHNYETDTWDVLPESDYSISGNTITGLTRAGEYRVTIEGMNAYKGTRTAADAACGTNISAYKVRIKSQITFPYNGTDQFPTEFVLYDLNRQQEVSTIDRDGFIVAYEREPNATYWDLNKDVGKIFVTAIGNPTEGYYGKTEAYDSATVRSYYEITPVRWDVNNFDIVITNADDVKYLPGGDTPQPEIELLFKTGQADPDNPGEYIWEKLDEGRDYTAVYNSVNDDGTLGNDLSSAGSKRITITGINNFSGNTNRVQNYTVLKREIYDDNITVEVGDVDYSTLKTVQFEIRHFGYLLVEGTDYTKTQEYDDDWGLDPIPNDTAKGEKAGFHVFYTIKGRGNYSEERTTVRVEVSIVDLSEGRATFAESSATANPGEYYVIWDQSELLIEDPMVQVNQRDPIKPAGFTIMYKVSDTRAVALAKYDADKQEGAYEILSNGYGTNKSPGNNGDNYVTIRGLTDGGYTGQRQLNFTLYTNIEGATLTETSLIQDNGVITKTDWMDKYTKAGEKGLLSFNQVSVDEKGTIDPDEYDLDWDATFDPSNPGVGYWTVRVNGSQAGAHCYYGTITIQFRIVNDINSAVISVGGSNQIQYKGPNDPVVVTAPGVNFTVTADGKELREGMDYEILGYTGNDRIGKATVTLRGMGDYSGTVDHDFKVVYPITDLVVFMEDPSIGRYVNRATQNVTYGYTGSEIKPPIMLYCPLDFPKNATDEDYLKVLPLDSSLYSLGYENNIHAGTGTVVIKDCPYFTGASGSTDGAQRGVTFSIVAGSIAPPPDGSVSYTSSIYPNAENIVATYKGESYTVEDLGIELSDHGETLQKNVDYAVYYNGDMQNVSGDNEDNWPSITFLGKGNYAGSEHTIPFQIVQKSIASDKSTDITANSVTLTYTDNAVEQTIINQMNVVLGTPSGNSKKLVNGTDYTIENYFNDAMCHQAVQAANGKLRTDGDTYFPTAQGTYYARIRGIGNFTDTRMVTIEITKKDLTNDIKINFKQDQSSDCMIDSSGEPNCTYNGREHKPAINVTYGSSNILLREETDYTVVYENNINAGTARVVVRMTPGGNYDGEFSRTFTIKPKSILQTEGGTIGYTQLEESYKFVPKPTESIKPPMTVTDFEMTGVAQTLEEDVDYTIDYQAESAAIEDEDDVPECSYGGKVVVVIKGIGNYTGEQKFVYYIGEDIGDAYVQVNGSNSISATYNGLMQLIPDSAIQVRTNSDNVLLELEDGTKRYGYAYYKGDLNTMVDEKYVVDAGTYYIAVTGNPRLGTYAKSTITNSCLYTIKARSIAQSYILVSGYDASYYYTGQEIEPKAIIVEDTDLPVTSNDDYQRRSVKLVNGTDYELSYINNVSAGKASIRVTGKGNYTGERYAYFSIISSDATGNNTGDGSSEGSGSLSNGTTTISASDIHLGFDNSANNCMMYNGYERIPTVSISGVNTNDFTVTATNNVAPGVATLIITGNGGNYTGAIYKNYLIKADLSQYGTIAGIADQTYSGYQITPSITLTCGGRILNQGTDYTVTYANNTNVGRATVTAHATSSSYYVGSATGGFNISNGAGGMQVTGYASAYTYTGNAITPDVVVTMNDRVLNRGTDYTVSYANNINVGTATMTITGIGSYSGTSTINFTIEAKNIENCLTTEVSDYQYNGSTYTPVITVTDSSTGKTLVAGTDYTITYSNNTNPGTAQITVTALSQNYTGTKVIPFQITSAAVSGLRTSTIKNKSIKLAWSAQSYADGYQICNSKNRVIATTTKNSYTVTGLASYTTYKYKVRSYVKNADGTVSYGSFSTAVSARTLLNTPSLTAKSTVKGRVTLKWTKISKATGYEIYYSTKKNGVYTKLKTISKTSTRSYVDKGLASGEKYYYTIRAYRTANGVKTYSSYNTIKSVTVK